MTFMIYLKSKSLSYSKLLTCLEKLYFVRFKVCEKMGGFIDLEEAEEKAKRAVEERIEDWYDLASYNEPVIESSDINQIGDTPIYILEGYIDVVLFTVKLDAENGKVLSIKQQEDEEEEEE